MGTHMHVPHVLPSYVCARTRVYHCIVHVYIYTHVPLWCRRYTRTHTSHILYMCVYISIVLYECTQ